MKTSLFLALMIALIFGGGLQFELDAQEVADTEQQEDAADRQPDERIDPGPTVSTADYFVVPVKTPLQRHLLNDEDVVAYANLNAKSFVIAETGLVDTQAIDFIGLRRALRELAKAQESGKLWIIVNYGYSPPTEASRGIAPFLQEAFNGMGRVAGFSDVRVHGQWWNDPNYVWQPLNVLRDLLQKSEENLGTESVRVYPVRTPLSRYLTDDADCYIRFDAPPLTEWKAESLTEIEEAVAEIDPAMRRKARVQVLVPDPESNTFDMPVDPVLAVLRGAGFREIRVGIQKGGEQRTWTYGPASDE